MAMDDPAGKGVQYAAQLARVTDRRPCIVALDSATNGDKQQLCAAVRLRATLVHCIVNGAIQVWRPLACVIRSPVPVVDVCAIRSSHDNDSVQRQLLVAVADGHIWRVTLPTKPVGALHPLVLPQNATDAFSTDPDACPMELVLTLPGVQTIAHHHRRNGSSIAVFTSILAPTTLVWSPPGHAVRNTNTAAAVELDALEAEQSTCALVLDGQQPVNHALLQWLSPETDSRHPTQASVLVLQGDVDGAVRFVLTHMPRSDSSEQISNNVTASATCTGTLVDIGQRVQFIVPFSSVSGGSLSSNVHGILVVGADGCAYLIQQPPLNKRHLPPALPLTGLPSVQLAAPIQLLVFVHWLGCFVYCARGTTYAFRASDVVLQRATKNNDEGKSATQLHALPDFSVKLPLPPGIVAIAVHESDQALTCVFASGRVLSMDRQRVQEIIARVLELSSSDTSNAITRTTGSHRLDTNSNETRIKFLLQRIANVSTAVEKLRAQSDQLDVHLGTMHAALQLQRHVAAQDTLAHHEDGVLLVSCSLVFQPGNLVNEWGNEESQSAPLFSFAIPLVHDQAFHLVRLSDILEEREIPMSHTAIRTAFRQDQDPLLSSAVSQRASDSKAQHSGEFALLPGCQLWSALSTHWDELPSFASLRWRDAQQQSHSHGELVPPLRFTMVFPACAFQELHVDSVVAIVLQVMQLPSSEALRVRASCRSQRGGGGKFWIGMQTCSGNVIVLRFALAEGTILMDGELLRPLEIVLQCSDHEDLSAMRALLVEGVPRSPGHEDMSMPLNDVFTALSLETADFRESIEETMALAAAVDEKIATQLRSASSSLCTDEVVRMLANLARIETKTLDLYWKCRHVLNKFVI
ncbi:hypothetical protein FI667_g17651, partial [Globisporangium splendens]